MHAPTSRNENWTVALRRHPMATARLGKVVPGGMVLGAPVVPDCNGVRFPTHSDLEVDAEGDVIEEHLE